MILANGRASAARNVRAHTSCGVLVSVYAVRLVRSPIRSAPCQRRLSVDQLDRPSRLQSLDLARPRVHDVPRPSDLVHGVQAPTKDGLVRAFLRVRAVDLAESDDALKASEFLWDGLGGALR